MKKPYQKPSILFTEKLEVRATACLLQADSVGACAGALIQ